MDFSSLAGQIDGCICAVNGLVLKMRQSKRSELGSSVDERAYRNRKEFFETVAMAGCNYDCRFNK